MSTHTPLHGSEKEKEGSTELDISFLLVHILLWSEDRECDRIVWKVGPLEKELNHGLSPRPVSLSNPLSDFEQVPLAPYHKPQRQWLTWDKGSRMIVLDQP